MNRKLYTLLLYLLTPIIWFYFLYRGIKDIRYVQGLKNRIGLIPEGIDRNGIHIHCASVGETRAALPLIKKIAQKNPLSSILITTTTPTGKDEVLKLISSFEQTNVPHSNVRHSNLKHSQIRHAYLPIDWPGACKRFVKKLQPKLSILMETELWPNLLDQLHRHDIPVLLANARLSDLSLKKYQKHLKLSQDIFSKISIVTAQYESDSQNFQALGVSRDNIQLIGSIKFDIRLSKELLKGQQQLKQAWSANRPSWIAASIHPAEFEVVLSTHTKLLEMFPDLLLIAVARHPERFNELKLACKGKNLSFISRTDSQSPTTEHKVMIGDTMGELTLMCGAANVAFVGGSLIDRGGHNPIEPAACGLPVIMGASYYNFSEISQMMQQQDALTIVNNDSELFQTLKKLFSDPILLTKKSRSAVQIFDTNRGAVDKIMNSIDNLL